MSKLHLGILGSGSGSNMQSVVDARENCQLDADVRLVLADVPDAKFSTVRLGRLNLKGRLKISALVFLKRQA